MVRKLLASKKLVISAALALTAVGGTAALAATAPAPEPVRQAEAVTEQTEPKSVAVPAAETAEVQAPESSTAGHTGSSAPTTGLAPVDEAPQDQPPETGPVEAPVTEPEPTSEEPVEQSAPHIVYRKRDYRTMPDGMVGTYCIYSYSDGTTDEEYLGNNKPEGPGMDVKIEYDCTKE